MGTCQLEGKPCSEYRQNIHPSKTMLRISTLEYLHPGRKPDIKWISTSYPPWISNEPEIEYFPSVMFYFPTTMVLIEGWSKHWNLGAIRPPVNCIESVSEVSQDNPLRLLQSCVHTCPCVIVCIWAPRAQNSIPHPLFKFNHVYKTVCHEHTPHSITCIFCPAGFDWISVFPIGKYCRCITASKRASDIWTTKPIAFNVRPDKIHRWSY